MPLVNQEAERIARGMKKNRHRFRELYGKRDKEVMYATANKLAQKKQVKQKTWKSGMGFKEEVVAEKCETRYCRLCRKKETRKQCAYGGVMWDRYAVKDATKEEQRDAAEESGISNGPDGMGESLEDAVLEGNKSGDNSLRDWFGKSKSSDGKPGWVQLGGKYAGKPCARQPGQTTKPKCGSSKMKRNLNKDEEEAAFRRKNAKDPNPDRKGKAINVKTEETQITEGEKDACYHKVKSRYSVWPSAYASGALVKCRKVGAKNWGNKSKKEEFEGLKSFSEFQAECWKTHKKVGMKMKGGKLVNDCRPKNEEVTNEAKKCWKGYEKKGTQKLFGKTYNRCVKKEENELEEGAAWTKKSGKNKSGGLNEKGRKSYERENPGSDLKAPSKKVGNPRRASFCARMKGMKKKLTSSKTANDPDSRINKSLRAWNC